MVKEKKMGDRAQVCVRELDERGVYLYTHWGGEELIDDVLVALKHGKDRWDDAEYLARIVFCQMVHNDFQGTTDFGIGTSMHGDLDHPLISLITDSETIVVGRVRSSFSEFVNCPETILKAYKGEE
jgi:hypothetical protein